MYGKKGKCSVIKKINIYITLLITIADQKTKLQG